MTIRMIRRALSILLVSFAASVVLSCANANYSSTYVGVHHPYGYGSGWHDSWRHRPYRPKRPGYGPGHRPARPSQPIYRPRPPKPTPRPMPRGR